MIRTSSGVNFSGASASPKATGKASKTGQSKAPQPAAKPSAPYPTENIFTKAQPVLADEPALLRAKLASRLILPEAAPTSSPQKKLTVDSLTLPELRSLAELDILGLRDFGPIDVVIRRGPWHYVFTKNNAGHYKVACHSGYSEAYVNDLNKQVEKMEARETPEEKARIEEFIRGLEPYIPPRRRVTLAEYTAYLKSN